MAANASFKSSAGVGYTLVVMGMFGLITQLGPIALRVKNLAGHSAGGALDSYAAVGFASLHVLQSAVFDHHVMLSLLGSMLVSFTAVVMIVTGLLLLRKGRVGQTQTTPPMFF